jgi:RimJ/RimL family protein N-acetyltransferase
MACDDIRIRRVVPEDAAGLERFYAELSPESRLRRFHAACRGISHELAETLAMADHRTRDGFVAVAGSRIVGHVLLEPCGSKSEEVAVAVGDRLQGRGIGTLLLAAALASARLRRVSRLIAWVQAENTGMRRLLVRSGHPLRMSWDRSVARYELAVSRELPRGAAA